MAEKEWAKFDPSNNELGLKVGDDVEIRFPQSDNTQKVKVEETIDGVLGFHFDTGSDGSIPVWIKLERVEVAKPAVEGG